LTDVHLSTSLSMFPRTTSSYPMRSWLFQWNNIG
jgi:hypothetical protein